MQAVGDVRVSTAEQATEGVSLAAQRARIAAWAEANEAELIEVFTDAGLSAGRADNRFGLAVLSQRVPSGSAHVSPHIGQFMRELAGV